MKNEPKIIYLNCYDEAETDESYLPIDDDFDSLDGENVLWSADSPCLGGNIKYIHYSEFENLQNKNKSIVDALEAFVNSVYTGCRKDELNKLRILAEIQLLK